MDLLTEQSEEMLQGIESGGLAYVQKGALIGGISPYKNHLSIEFSNGAG